MKAEELMIGDWLFYRGQFNAFPFKVEQITKKKVGYHAEPNESMMYYLRLYECNPIPLTPEILERNGFIYITSQGIYEFCTDDYRILWPTDDKNTLAINSYFAKYGILTKSDIDYVHQLQHALRLCGINKQIKL